MNVIGSGKQGGPQRARVVETNLPSAGVPIVRQHDRPRADADGEFEPREGSENIHEK